MSKFSLSSLRSRAIILVLLAIFPLLALTLYSYFDQRYRAIREVQRDELVSARNLAAIQETVISDARQLLATLAQLPQVQRRDRDACNALFAKLLEQCPYRAVLAAADLKGQVFASAPTAKGPVNIADRFFFQKAIETRSFVVGEPVLGRISHKYSINLAYPILDDMGQIQGVLTVGVDLNWLGSLLAKSEFPPTTAMVLTDSSRKVLFRYPEPLKYIGKIFPDFLVKAMTTSDEGVTAGVGLPGDERLFAFARLSPPWQDMRVAIGLPKKWAVNPVNRHLWYNLIWVGLVALFAIVAAWYGGDIFIVRPVKKLRAITERLAAGDLSVRAGPDYAVGELGFLAHSFDQMADSLQEREEALRRAKEEWERTFDAVPDLVAILDEHHHIVRVNRRMAKVLETKPEDLIGRACYEVMHHSSGPLPICPHSQLLDDGREHIAELRELGRDFLVSASPLRDDRGNLIGSVHVARDITELKQAEEALRRAKGELEQRVQERTAELSATNERLLREGEDRQLAEKQAESIGRLYRLLSRVNETIVRAQDQEWLFRQACRIMMEEGDFQLCWIGRVDWEAGVVRAAAQFDLVEDYPQNITISLADVPEGRGPTGVAVRERRWDVCLDIAGDPRMAPWREQARARGFRSSAAFPLFVGGKVEGVLTLYSGQKGFFNPEEVEVLNSLAQDLSFAMESMDRESKRRQAEEEIRRLNEELERRVEERTAELKFANRELEAFSYSVSHDLKAPIRAIQGFSQMLMGEQAAQLDAEGLRLLNVITSNTKLMAALIDDLLALSRVGRHEIRKGNVNLTAMANQIFEQLKSQNPERVLQLIIKDLPPAHGDPSLINQVIVNLLTNAVKYTKQRKSAVIEVGGMYEGNETIYYVKDNGIGFDERYADKLFGVFQRLHTGEEYEGTGVGLAIVKRIIQRHGGRVWAEGKVDGGATFHFALPKKGVMAK